MIYNTLEMAAISILKDSNILIHISTAAFLLPPNSVCTKGHFWVQQNCWPFRVSLFCGMVFKGSTWRRPTE